MAQPASSDPAGQTTTQPITGGRGSALLVAGWWVLWILMHNIWIVLLTLGLAALTARSLADTLGWPLALGAGGGVALLALALYAHAARKIAVRDEFVIHRPVAEVFQFVATDFFQNRAGRAAQGPGIPRIIAVEQTSAGPMRVGATGREVLEEQGRRAEWLYTVTEYAPDERFALRGHTRNKAEIACWYQFAAVADGTRIAIRYELTYHGLARIWTPFLAGYLRARSRANIAQLRKLLEAPTPGT
jgi:hypothetical protein